MDHPYTLRAPWYVRERDGISEFDAAAERPAIQKYATADFVDRLLADPRDSLGFDDADRWSFPVPVGAFPTSGPLRERLSTHRLVPTHLRKLYQPSHERFYAVAVELFCDEPGLPRPGDRAAPQVGFVVRRLRVDIRPPGAQELRQLARLASDDLFSRAFPEEARHDPHDDLAEDLSGLMEVDPPGGLPWSRLGPEYAELLAKLTITRAFQGWVVGGDGRGRWTAIVDNRPSDPSHGEEQELPMWRLPPRPEDCDAARTRSLWFGVVPTFSGDFDTRGAPRFDDHAIYVVQCFARQPPPPGREDCPPVTAWSGRSRPYRLAAFLDPQGTRNRQVRVKLPDLRALAATAAEPASAGGVQFERPAGSQLSPGSLGTIPTPRTGGPTGTATELCSYAIELITIVASFVLALFLPVVVFAFQLWWMLLLRFCWPPNQTAVDVLHTHFTAPVNGTIATLQAAGRDDEMDAVIGVAGATAQLATVTDANLATDTRMGLDLVDALQPQTPPSPAVPAPASLPDDPLCPPGPWPGEPP
jgi:hypothetical protein